MPPKSLPQSSSTSGRLPLRPATRSQKPLSQPSAVSQPTVVSQPRATQATIPTLPINKSDQATRDSGPARYDDENAGLLEQVLKFAAIEKPSGVEKQVWDMITGTLRIMATFISNTAPKVDSSTISVTSDFERASIEAAKKERMQRCVVLRMNAQPGYLKFNQTTEGVRGSIQAEDEETARVREILRYAGCTVRPLCIWRMSEYLVKVEMPSKAAAQYVITNAHLLNSSPHRGIGIRPSLPKKERDRYNELRRAQLYLRQVARKETVVYALSLRSKDNIREVVEVPPIPEDWKPNRREYHAQGVGVNRPPVQFPLQNRRLDSNLPGSEN